VSDRSLSVIRLLPQSISSVLATQSRETLSKTTEIRIRRGRPISLTLDNRTIFPNKCGYSLIPDVNSFVVEPHLIEKCFLELCDNSVYSHEEEISQGYLILNNGHRAGICGRMIRRSDKSSWITDISSINIRIAREIHGAANSIYSQISDFSGVLICGAPNTGKTTLLRDYIRILSNNGQKMALVDCRGEIAAVKNGLCGLDVGVNTDVITGGKKSEGIESAIRVLSPNVIAFDEIGSVDELIQISQCFNAGVRIITTFHCEDIEQLKSRNKTIPILDTGVFSHLVFLDKSHNAEVVQWGDINREVIRDNGADSVGNSHRIDVCFQAY